MKIRIDFVTNSSSSSYIVIAKVDMNPALLDEMKEEFGKYGIRMLDENIITGEELIERVDEKYEEKYDVDTYINTEGRVFNKDDHYIIARFYTWSTEGDFNGDDAWLYDHIPEKYLSDRYEGDVL